MNKEVKEKLNIEYGKLKDFQKATVEHVIDLFLNDRQNRVLVADEVGLGKTMVARGVVTKLLGKQEKLRVVYICSNLSVASQNICKLNILKDENVKIENTRLSMQHLNIAQNEATNQKNNSPLELIALTPSTSFSITGNRGNAWERVLMYEILKRIFEKDSQKKEIVDNNNLDRFLIGNVTEKNWNNYYKIKIKERIDEAKNTNDYPKNVIEEITNKKENASVLDELYDYLKKSNVDNKSIKARKIFKKIRNMFSDISIDQLKPDLVILDEFQRFKYLINDDIDKDVDEIEKNNQKELQPVIKKFFSKEDLKILLLSATPYKLYSTMQDDENAREVDNGLKEFFDVINFLYHDKSKNEKFKEKWIEYSKLLSKVNETNFENIKEKKEKVEKLLYSIMCRTEREEIKDSKKKENSGDLFKNVKTINLSEDDILSYYASRKVVDKIGETDNLRIDYVKSCPYIFSFMLNKNYALKDVLVKYYKEHIKDLDEIDEKENDLSSALLWIDKEKIDNYEELNVPNSKYKEIEKLVFEHNAEKLLWVPPTKPYYKPSGVYKETSNFSKFIIFSSWAMVPRMLSTLLSYESERRNKNEKDKKYFDRPTSTSKLNFKMASDGNPNSLRNFTLLYPCKELEEVYNPMDYISKNYEINDIVGEIKKKIEEKLKVIYNTNVKIVSNSKTKKESWYYLAPMLLDGKDTVNKWLNINFDIADKEVDINEDNYDTDKNKKIFKKHIESLKEKFNNDKIELVAPPDDLAEQLAYMAIASPAICAYRTFKSINIKNANGAIEILKFATIIADNFRNLFNLTESANIVDSGSKNLSDDIYWQRVLKYCANGNFQAMLDEYYHLLKSNYGFDSIDSLEKVIELFKSRRSIPYKVDTFDNFVNRVKEEKEKEFTISTNFASAFLQTDGDDKKQVDSRDALRDAFNSPFRPFVLVSTSIGQEGLDFHNYCKKIVHWNLPSNPLDFNQREGRINRYKCLAIRQAVVKEYDKLIDKVCDSNIWDDMFEKVSANYKGKSELYPFWCMDEVDIERILLMYPYSKEVEKYHWLSEVLEYYRLTLGQPRQEELLNATLAKFGEKDREKLKQLFINLCPYKKRQF